MINKSWRALFSLIIIFSLHIQHNFAAEINNSNFLNEDFEKILELKERFKFTSLVLKVSDEIDSKLQIEFKANESPLDEPERLAQILNESIDSYADFYSTHLKLTKIESKRFKDTFRNIDWNVVVKSFKKAHLGIETFFKKKGIGLGLAILCGFLTEYLVPTVLIQLGLAKFIPLSMLTPWGGLYSLIPNLYQKAKVNALMEETLGTKDRVKFYKSQLEEIAHVFQQENPDFYLIPFSHSDNAQEVNALIVHDEPMWKRFLSHFNYRNKELNLTSLTQFLKENSIESGYIDWILGHRKIDRELKVAMIVNHLYSLPEQSGRNLFEERFLDKIKVIRDIPNSDKLWQWLKSMKKVRTVDELLLIGSQYDKNISPVLMAKIWEEILMPHYIEKLQVSYSEARDMQLQFEVFKAKTISLKNDWQKLSSSERQLKLQHEVNYFLNRLNKGKAFLGCEKTNLAVLRFLKP